MSGVAPEVLLYAMLLGVGLGAVFTGFEVLRTVLAFGKVLTFMLDTAFCVTAAAASFILALAVADGTLRFYQLACEVLGFACVYLTVTCAVRSVLRRLMRWAAGTGEKVRRRADAVGRKILRRKPKWIGQSGKKGGFFGIRLKKSKKKT